MGNNNGNLEGIDMRINKGEDDEEDDDKDKGITRKEDER